ncbi:Type III secretion injected virulence protein [Salmonella enterica subsp. VII serovar 1,40:g,z51:--]|nr:Type III secretion injected virulence protein [Salmonella enterica subsp. VII str. CFSAN000550]EDU7900942.1 Type III secretion injected virulence protein [Salmonella enterica subsp. houtenae]EEO7411286.1 Type III secretion injected virulence protein [Salmonella enterica]QJY67629.1 Type III secretion injected virulence protein [Salmonella enterica subsp. VII serovar 1,40:g,z51:--]HCL5369141.1 Type III secretion injected virulence protein [Salmonella enterica]
MNNLTLSSFSKTGLPSDTRLYIAKDNSRETYVAPEKFASKVLTWLGNIPLFKNIAAVQKHTENTRVQDQKSLQVFLKALTERYDEQTINAVAVVAGLNDTIKPLTPARIQQITEMAENAKEGFSKDIMSKQHVGLPKHFSLVVKGGEIKVPEQNVDADALKTQMLLEIAVNGLKRTIPQLEKVDGKSLRENFHAMSSGNGALRSLMTNLTNLKYIPEAKQLNDDAIKLKGIPVGVALFSQWGTNGGEVAKWIDKASDQELTLAAKSIQAIIKEVQKIATELSNIKIGAPVLQS